MTAPHRPVFALAYDFDGTLAPGNMQEHSFIPALNMSKEAFWAKSDADAKAQDGDHILLYMHRMLEEARHANLSRTRGDLVAHGTAIKLFEGVAGWFGRITAAGEAMGLDVRHFIISSGLREIIEGTPIARYFERIYASGYLYDSNMVAIAPALAVNYTNKTQFLFRINKWTLDVSDHRFINKHVPKAERPVPFARMVFIGDGETDVPCMRLVTEQGGTSIAVYQPHQQGAEQAAQGLLRDGRVRFAVPADYRDGKALDVRVRAVMDSVAAGERLAALPSSA